MRNRGHLREDRAPVTINEIDTHFSGRPGVVCCHEIDGVLIDPGPDVSIANVIDALGDRELRAVLLTHIHLDHAGGTGRLVERYPDLVVYVHETGAPHLVDPVRLLASATRVFGEIEPIFGETLPIPSASIRTIADGERVEGFEVVHTPGHSGHHLAFLHEATGVAIAGDLVGESTAPFDAVIMSTPPPEVDVELWIESIDKLAAMSPTALALTHFGRIEDPLPQFDRARKALIRGSEAARLTDATGFIRYLEAELAPLPPEIAERIVAASPPLEQLWAGYERYWRKKSEAS